jgi:hypothetical protein
MGQGEMVMGQGDRFLVPLDTFSNTFLGHT